jgi:hypothetical protein
MEAMLGISLYSYPNLNYQKHFVLLITVHTPSSTKLYAHINNQKKKKSDCNQKTQRSQLPICNDYRKLKTIICH